MFGTPKPAADDHTFVAELTPYQRLELLSIMRKQSSNAVNKGIIEALELAERLDLPPIKREDWDRRERWAQAGYSLIDQLIDGFHPKEDPSPKPTLKPPGETA
jgi:hypothetical protein